ncbi:hypothetical protein BKA69DRAFT_1089583 [Paraphysoderma sedebokerense]|nr:hypothetical protein BKA69DRAFT_1089583 [Paraphysoderma sedebokerense]
MFSIFRIRRPLHIYRLSKSVLSFSTSSNPGTKSNSPSTRSRSLLYNLTLATGSTTLIYYLYSYYNSFNAPTLTPYKFVPWTVTAVELVSKDTKFIRLTSPSNRIKLEDDSELKIPFHVHIKNDTMQVVRPYTPIRTDAGNGVMEFIVKRYPDGETSKWMHRLKVGDKIEIRGPLTTWPFDDKFKQIGMIAGGTGIAPFYQLIQYVLSSESKVDVKLSLIYANKSYDDILLKKELDDLSETYPDRFKVYYTVEQSPENEKDWVKENGVGFVQKDMIQRVLPSSDNDDDAIVLVCGNDGMIGYIAGERQIDSQGEVGGLLKDLGYQKHQVYKL